MNSRGETQKHVFELENWKQNQLKPIQLIGVYNLNNETNTTQIDVSINLSTSKIKLENLFDINLIISKRDSLKNVFILQEMLAIFNNKTLKIKKANESFKQDGAVQEFNTVKINWSLLKTKRKIIIFGNKNI